MAEPIVKIAHTVSRIAICDREIGRLNATSTARFGYIRPVLSGAAPAITALFQEGVVWDTFVAVAGCQLFLAGQALRTNCTSNDQRVCQRRFEPGPVRGRKRHRFSITPNSRDGGAVNAKRHHLRSQPR